MLDLAILGGAVIDGTGLGARGLQPSPRDKRAPFQDQHTRRQLTDAATASTHIWLDIGRLCFGTVRDGTNIELAGRIVVRRNVNGRFHFWRE